MSKRPVFNDGFGKDAGKDIDDGVMYDPLPGDHRGDASGLVRWPMPLPRRTAEEIERDFAAKKAKEKKNGTA